MVEFQTLQVSPAAKSVNARSVGRMASTKGKSLWALQIGLSRKASDRLIHLMSHGQCTLGVWGSIDVRSPRGFRDAVNEEKVGGRNLKVRLPRTMIHLSQSLDPE